MIPTVTINKSDGNTGVVRPGAEGILAVVAPSASGVPDVAATYMKPKDVAADLGKGRLASFIAYVLGITKKPVVAVKTVASTAGAYGAFALAGTGTSVPSAGGTAPLDQFGVSILVVNGGTIGVAGITYQTSIDGGVTYGPTTALGTASAIVIADTGVTVDFAAGTLVAGDVVTCTTTAPAPTTGDLTAALEALRVTKQPWEGVLIDAPASSTIIAQVDAWLTALEAVGQFKFAILNTRLRNAGETEAAYATAMAAVVGGSSSIRLGVCSDGGDSVDWNLGVDVARPASLAVAARAMAIPIGQDPAEVALGPVTNFDILDTRSNPKYHNEENFPGLDTLRLGTLRTMSGYSEGTYITNALMLSPGGSDYVYLQHARTMNKTCSLAWQGLTAKLSKGVRKSTKVGSNGERYIDETSAQEIEQYVNSLFTQPLNGQVDSAQLILHRDDNIAPNQGAIISADVEVVALAYVKGFIVRAGFVKTITATI